MRRKKLSKIIVLLFCIIVLVILFLNYFHDKYSNVNLSSIDVVNAKNLNNNLVTNIIINNYICPFDSKNNVCYFSKKSISNSLDIKVESKENINYYYVKIDDYKYKLIVYSNKFYQFVDIIITDLPIISIYDLDISNYKFYNSQSIDYYVNSDDFNNEPVSVELINSYNYDNDFIKDRGVISIRGSSSVIFPKKSYKITLENKYSALNINSEDKWVLDALFMDKSKIRNKLSSDIWNSINNNQKINNDLNGEFVEVFFNNQYLGLYVLKEKVDKSVTALDEDGLILKSIAHSTNTYINRLKIGNFAIKDNFFLNYEIKHYNANTFKSAIEKLQSYYINLEDYTSINNAFIMDNYINYKIFVALIGGSDNISYNQYYSIKNDNSNILITPWDMDLTWGLSWDDNENLHNVFSMESSYDINWLDTNITNNMDEQTLNILKQRYWELRKDTITMDNINKYLDEYKELLVSSGAAKRDSDRWYDYDIEYEIEQIRKWANNRIIFLDEYFKI